MKSSPEHRQVRKMWNALAKAIGPGRAPSAQEIEKRYQGWKAGAYDPTTGVWS